MKLVKTKNCEIKVPSGMSGRYPTPPEMPRANGIFVAVARRGGGKSVAISNLVRLMEFDRIFLISPTASSNKAILDPLKIDPDDVYEDLDDPKVIDYVIEKVNQERDDLEEYNEKMKDYKAFLKMLNDHNQVIPDRMLMSFYRNGSFEPPQHKWGGRKPKIALIVDDAQNSKVFTGKKLPNLCIKHRHYGQMKEGGSIGLSVFLMCQNYKCVAGGLPKPVRSNATGWLLFKNSNEKEKQFVAEELSFDISDEKFLDMWDEATKEPFNFLFVDTDKKKEHPSAYRINFDKFIV